jgi:uncharacterized membrane protein
MSTAGKPAREVSPDEVIKGVIPIGLLQPGVIELINRDFPDCVSDGVISLDDLQRVSRRHVKNIFKREHEKIEGKSTDPEDLKHPELPDIGANFGYEPTRGERLADQVAKFGGSWMFIVAFGLFLAVWMTINRMLGEDRAWDPFPFILLNLCLSTLAALQAPVIMMSQNRQEQRERLRSEYDFRTNLRAEIEIRNLTEKVDRLLAHQWERLEELRKQQEQARERPPL